MSMGVGNGQGGKPLPGSRNFQPQNVVVLVSSGKNRISPLLVPPRKTFGKLTRAPPSGKNPSGPHAHA